MTRVPTSAEINALPDASRQYIHDLETRADPCGDLRCAHLAEENAVCLHALVLELERRIERRNTALHLIAILLWAFGGIGSAVMWLGTKPGPWLGIIWLVVLVLLVRLEPKQT